jgi:hypothetical protein
MLHYFCKYYHFKIRFLGVIKNAFNFIYFAELTGGGDANVDCSPPEAPCLLLLGETC